MKNHHGFVAAAVAAALSAPLYAADVSISGAVEVEAGMVEGFDGSQSTDIAVATAAVGLDAQINERVSATVAFLFEEDETEFGLDEGYFTMQLNNVTSLVAGRTYVPFGSFESNMVSDPLTLELGEISETVLMLALGGANISGSLYTFNGDTDEAAATDNDALSFGANIAFANDNLSLGASYISNIADSDSLQTIDDPNAATVDTPVAGMGVSFGYTVGNFSVLAEHVTAAESFTNGDLNGAIQNEEKPRATNVEVAYQMNGTTLAVGYQVSSDTAFLGLPKYVTSVALSFEPMQDVSMGIEYAALEDFEVNGGETGSALTAQLAVEF